MTRASKSVKEERARIVSWLRAQARGYRDSYMTMDLERPYSRNELALASCYAERFAVLLEQGLEGLDVFETLIESDIRRKASSCDEAA